MNKIQTGVFAKRDKDGNFLPARPIYKEGTSDVCDMTEQEKRVLNDIAKIFAEKFGEYIIANAR